MRNGLIAITITLESEAELRELQAAGFQRVDVLTKTQKKALDDYLPENAAIAARHLATWQGRDGEPGLTEKIQQQMNLFEPAAVDSPAAARAQRDWTEEVPSEGGEEVGVAIVVDSRSAPRRRLAAGS
jgi:hypothetical protein